MLSQNPSDGGADLPMEQEIGTGLVPDALEIWFTPLAFRYLTNNAVVIVLTLDTFIAIYGIVFLFKDLE